MNRRGRVRNDFDYGQFSDSEPVLIALRLHVYLRGAMTKKKRAAKPKVAKDSSSKGAKLMPQEEVVGSLDAALTYLSGLASTPGKFCEPNKTISDQLLLSIKQFFDTSKVYENASCATTLNELYVEGLDLEQVWEQIKMDNRTYLEYAQTTAAELASADLPRFDETVEEEMAEGHGREESNSSENEQDHPDVQNSPSPTTSEDEEDGEASALRKPFSVTTEKVQNKKKSKASFDSGNDTFFNMNEFEAFADGKEDLGELDSDVDIYGGMYMMESGSDSDEEETVVSRNSTNHLHSDSSEEEDFGDGVDLEREGPKRKVVFNRKSGKPEKALQNSVDDDDAENLKYSDFFVVPSSHNDHADREQSSNASSASDSEEYSQVEEDSNIEGRSSSDSNDDEGMDEAVGDMGGVDDQNQSRHAKYVEAKQKEIAELEKEVLQQKSWDMLGESSNKDRPQNSLLELDLDYQQTVKVAPTITAEVTQTLEEMIKQRINDEMWDDVERQVEDQGDKRKRVLDEVSTEKSKLGLGDIYAKEYEENILGNASTKDIETEKLHNEVNMLWNQLSLKLDSLFSHHFTPRPVVDDLNIKPSVSSIQMEEILPIGVSSSTGLAPEEVFKKKRGRDGFLVGEDELDQDDRTRRRRAKKTARRKNRQAKAADEKLVARLNPGLGNKYAKKKAVEMLSNARNVTTGTTTAASNFTNSASFFSDLSETVANPNAKRTRVEKKSGDSGSKHKL